MRRSRPFPFPCPFHLKKLTTFTIILPTTFGFQKMTCTLSVHFSSIFLHFPRVLQKPTNLPKPRSQTTLSRGEFPHEDVGVFGKGDSQVVRGEGAQTRDDLSLLPGRNHRRECERFIVVVFLTRSLMYWY